jgi:hypothetical protein
LQDRPKFTQIGSFGLKMGHLATLLHPVMFIFVQKSDRVAKEWHKLSTAFEIACTVCKACKNN